MKKNHRRSCSRSSLGFLILLLAIVFSGHVTADDDTAPDRAADFELKILPLLQRYCYDCHAVDVTEADIDLGGIDTIADVRSQIPVWLKVREMIDSEQMPPNDSPQPTEGERMILQAWVHAFLAGEADRFAGDPGPVVLRRLNNEEYNYTVRDLTGVETLDPTREFPVDGAAGEGFINTGSAQSMSPALVTKYLDAAKEVASHAVLIPTGIRFSSSLTRRDQTDELLSRIRTFYRRFVDDNAGSAVDLQGVTFNTNQGGVIAIEEYLTATLAERSALSDSRKTILTVAEERSLNAKYLGTLWRALTAKSESVDATLMDDFRNKWRQSTAEDAASLAAEIEQTQQQIWKFNSVGQLTEGGKQKIWMEPVNPTDGQHEFRELFPPALCYTQIVPVDEVVTMTLFFRDDQALQRLMLDQTQIAELDQLWDELLYVAQEPLALTVVFEQIYQFATQDRPDLVIAFEPLRQPINDRAERFRERLKETETVHLDAMLEFAGRAWRRRLKNSEQVALREFYFRLRRSELGHEEAIQLTLARTLASPAFLYRLEQPVVGTSPAAVTGSELATRLSYFLWSSMPDDELREVGISDQIVADDMLLIQTRRMLKDARARRLAIQFACQWLHLRDFDRNNDKNENLYPEFATLREDMYEETVLFFDDLFRNDGSVLDLLNADHTFLNETLANHYGIDDVVGPAWRRVDGTRELGRGGVLGMATVLASQSGASRTSPILRGNWVYETLLGQRLPRPPANVPQLPEALPTDLTARQLIEQHSSAPECAKCHIKIDGFGFALEQYDAIGQLRSVAVNTQAELEDGSKIERIDGLRDYLANERRDDVVRQFCRKLTGFALGREILLSDEPLLDRMVKRLSQHDYRFSVAVESIVTSDQFRKIRGLEATANSVPQSDP